MYGQEGATPFSATVSSSAGVPSGTVNITTGSTVLCTITLTGGNGSCALGADQLTVGTYPVTATYVPDNGDFTGSSTSAFLTVRKAISKTVLTSSPSPSVSEQPVTYTATVSIAAPGLGQPTGTVDFTESGASICSSVSLNTSGIATCTVTYPDPAGSPHRIMALYSGDSNVRPSSSAVLSQVVGKAPTTLVATPAKAGLFSLTFSATLTRSFDGAPLSGQSVVFRIKSTTECTATTDTQGVASCKKSGLFLSRSGTYTATYAGNTVYLGSTGSAKL
jgi:hypothetical protein